MAITVSANQAVETRFRNMRIFSGTIAMDASYPTGGESLDGIAKDLDYIYVVGGSGYVWEFVKATNSLKAMKMAGTTPNIKLTEEANATDLSAETGLKYFAIKLYE